MMLPQRRNAFKINSMKRGENNNLEGFVRRDAYFPGKGHPLIKWHALGRRHIRVHGFTGSCQPPVALH